MTREAMIASDIVIALVGVLSGGFFAWFAVQGLRSGVVETKFGNPVRAVSPVRFWCSIGVYAVGLLFSAAAIVFGALDIGFGFRV